MNDLYSNRISQLRKKLETSASDSILIADANNLRYLCGLQNHHPGVAYLILTGNRLFLITDYRYAEQAKNECPQANLIIRDRQNESLGNSIVNILNADGCDSLVYETSAFSVAQFTQLQKEFKQSYWQGGFDGQQGWVESLRMRKDSSEIAAIQKAASIADDALTFLKAELKLGMTERDAALMLEYKMQQLGSEGMAFDTIFLSGERSALPHGTPSHRQLGKGDLITIDFGAVVEGYRSDMTRALVVGEPSKQQIAVFETVLNAQAAALATIASGIKASEPYLASKSILDASEFSQYQGEGIGHGVGLYLHEQPFLQANNSTLLEPGMVITVEPGIYIPGWGGVRLEDDVLVTEKGYEQLTQSSNQLFEI